MLSRVLVVATCLFLFSEWNLAAEQNTQQAPQTEHGHPDLQGLWTNSTTTPLERPDSVGEQTTYSDEEIAIFDDAVIYKRSEYWNFRFKINVGLGLLKRLVYIPLKEI